MANPVQFWLSFDNGAEKLRLPVNPPSLGIRSSHGYHDVKISRLGEFTVIGETELDEYSFESFFPEYYNSTYCEYNGFPSPRECIELLRKWRDSRNPIRLTITGSNINEAVTIRELDYDEVAHAHNGDIPFKITLKQFKFVSFRTTTGTSGSSRPRPVPQPSEPTSTPAPTPAPARPVVPSTPSQTLVAGVSTTRPSRPDTRVTPRTYRTKGGDTLWKVA